MLPRMIDKLFSTSIFNTGNATPGDERAKSRRNILFFGYTSTVVNNLVGGNLLIGYMLLLGAGDRYIGTFSLVTTAMSLVQMFSPLVMERLEKRKSILLAARGMVNFLNIIALGLVNFLPVENQTKLVLVLVIILGSCLVNAVMNPGMAIWHLQSIPEEVRARYYAFFNISSNIILLLSVFSASKLVDAFKQRGAELEGLLLIRLAALILCLLDFFFLWRIKEYSYARKYAGVNIKNILIYPLREKKYLKTTFVACLYCFSINIPGSFYTIYLLKDLKLDYSFINLVGMAYIPAVILFTPVWRKIIERTSWFKAMFIALALLSFTYAGQAFVTGDTVYLYPVTAIYGMFFGPGTSLIFLNLPYVNIPEGSQTNFFGFFSTMTTMAGMLGLFCGLGFIEYTAAVNVSILGTGMQNKQYICLLTGAVMLTSSIIIYFAAARKAPEAGNTVPG